jgi:hypothetical protein
MNTYFFRCKQSDAQTLIALGVTLGALVIHTSEETQEPIISATEGGHWDVVGTIYRPPGELDSESVPVTAPIVDEKGDPYWHANLTTPINLRKRAEELAVDRPEIAEGLANIGKFFVVDDKGNPKAPAQPHRIMAGWQP